MKEDQTTSAVLSLRQEKIFQGREATRVMAAFYEKVRMSDLRYPPEQSPGAQDIFRLMSCYVVAAKQIFPELGYQLECRNGRAMAFGITHLNHTTYFHAPLGTSFDETPVTWMMRARVFSKTVRRMACHDERLKHLADSLDDLPKLIARWINPGPKDHLP